MKFLRKLLNSACTILLPEKGGRNSTESMRIKARSAGSLNLEPLSGDLHKQASAEIREQNLSPLSPPPNRVMD
jgi:hypothetical protein